jgi:hypothetical protein
MTLKISSGFVDDLLENPGIPKACLVGTDIAFVDGGTGNDSITRTSGSWITDGFEVGDWIQVFGATTSANNVLRKILALSATTLELVTGSVNTAEAGAAATAVVSAKGASINDLLKFGFIKIFTGAQPANADAAETGTELVKITNNGGIHNTSTGENGLEFDDNAATGKLSKLSTQTWKGAPGNSGDAGWFRFYAQEGTAGVSSTAVRFDGAVGLSGSELNVASVAIAVGTDFTINQFDILVAAGS